MDVFVEEFSLALPLKKLEQLQNSRPTKCPTKKAINAVRSPEVDKWKEKC